jgi:hypothetical protein
VQYELAKEDLINMICGTQPTMEQCTELTSNGIMEFCGNQHNPDWKFDREMLDTFSEIDLFSLYNEIT